MLWQDARFALAGRDPVLDAAMDAVPTDPTIRLLPDLFTALSSGVCHLIFDSKRGERNFEHLIEANNGVPPVPVEVLSMDNAVLRSCVNVPAHADWLRDMAKQLIKFPDFEEKLWGLDDSQAAKALRTMRGVGPWLAQWCLMYYLGRPDVLLVGDASLRRAMKHAYGDAVPLDAKGMEDIARAWSGHRSAASWFLFMAHH